MNKNIAIGVLAVSLIFLLYVVFSDGCGKDTDSHTDDHQLVMAQLDSANARERAEKRRGDSLEQSLHQSDAIIKDLTTAEEARNEELNQSKNVAYRLAVELQNYKREPDTSEFGRKLDSLLSEVVRLKSKLDDYQILVDSLQRQYGEQQMTYEILLEQKADLYSKLRESYNAVHSQYNNLFSDYTDRGKNIKREKLKGKIAAVLALVATGLLILK